MAPSAMIFLYGLSIIVGIALVLTVLRSAPLGKIVHRMPPGAVLRRIYLPQTMKCSHFDSWMMRYPGMG